jgi:hypothetical protein
MVLRVIKTFRDQLWDLFYETGASDLRVVTASQEGTVERAAVASASLKARDIAPPMPLFQRLFR